MVVICDVKEYRNCIDTFKIPLLSNLFNILHALCNLLIVVPENLKQVSNGDQLVSVVKKLDGKLLLLLHQNIKLISYFSFPNFLILKVGLDKNVIQSFIQLRADYKSAKLLNYLK
ncbi:Exocyst complex component 5 [Sarcoptes scabiei]|nr:Exocyst complex component 5 [Sarcoptes scabiei]